MAIPPAPVPPSRPVRNDRAILAGALKVVDEEGWSALTPRHVAEACGVSRTAVLSRHPERPAIAVAVWRSRIAEPLLKHWTELVAVVDAGRDSQELLQAAMEPFLFPDASMRAAAELMLVSRYDTEVQAAIVETVGARLADWTTPARGQVSRSVAARRAFVMGLAHGYLTEARRHAMSNVDVSAELANLAHAIAYPAPASRLPATSASYLDSVGDFTTDEPMVDAVLHATLDLVGTIGYDAATIEMISTAAGYTRSVIFNRYHTKRDLFLDATNRMLSDAAIHNDEYQQAIAASRGMAIAETCLLREFMRPGRDRMRTITFEQLRLSWHDADMLAAIDTSFDQLIEYRGAVGTIDDETRRGIRGRFVTEIALGHGIVTLCGIQPNLWDLPYDVIMVPFRAS